MCLVLLNDMLTTKQHLNADKLNDFYLWSLIAGILANKCQKACEVQTHRLLLKLFI